MIRLSAFFACAFAVVSGCQSVDSATDCNSVCDKYRACYDDDFDADNCTEDCVDRAANDDEYRTKVNSCDACIEDSDCVDTTFDCLGECDGVVDP